ncbi:hypothetical protein TNCV_3860281 [Trichonephila clavipes]|nr:hypothetical protein TNCV_3860281 [Trichonephila clavipes]
MEKHTPRQRQLQYISEFSCTIQHVLGKDNVADALSRIESISEINFDAIAEEKARDKELQQLLHSNSLKFKPSTLLSGKKNFGVRSQRQKLGFTSHRNLGFNCSN